jgi:hypothetical protein
MRNMVVIAFVLVGCARQQSDACKKLVVCSEAGAAGTGASLELSYGAKSSCWTSNEAADHCTQACNSALEGLRHSPVYASVDACK